MTQRNKIITAVPSVRLHIISLKTSILMMLIAITLLFVQVSAQQAVSKPDWPAFQFLLGTWTGDGSGDPGQGNGTFTFSMGLQDHIILRQNQSNYPETKTHAAFSHNDLMVIYQKLGHSAQAIYFDNENHTIEYNASITDNKKSIIFISDSSQAGPRFKLAYTSLADDSLLITFEIAPPTQPDNFSKYLEGRAHRTTQHSESNTEKNIR